MASRRIVDVSASVIFPCTIKSRRWQAIQEEGDKGRSEFCVTVGTVTRTASILIHSWSKALAVNLSRLQLYAGLIGSNNPRWLKALRKGSSPMQWTLLSERILLLLPRGCELVKVSSGTGSPRQSRTKAIKWLCVLANVSAYTSN